MSRIVNRPIVVQADETGQPLRFVAPGHRQPARVHTILSHWREWIAALDGEPERDVWRIDSDLGVCELHQLRMPPAPQGTGDWVLYKWLD